MRAISLPALIGITITALSLAGCDKRYEDLATKFPYVGSARQGLSTGRVAFQSPEVPGIYHLGEGMLDVQIGSHDISLRPPLALRLVGPSTSIPASQVGSCSKSCSGPGEEDTDLIVPAANVVISFQNAESLAAWCWSNRVPVVGRRDRDKWQYGGQALPQGDQFESQSAYVKRLNEACHAGT